MEKSRWLNAGLPLSAVGLALTLSACSGDIPSSPNEAAPPSHAIQDALNGEGGNPFVFLKPPVVDEPASSEFGVFDPGVEAIVEICLIEFYDESSGSCTKVLKTNDGSPTDARYTSTGGPGGEAITVDPIAEEYQLQIHFSLFDLSEGDTARIAMRTEGGILAYADLILLSGREMKNADTEDNIVFANDMMTLPWKARIDHGARCWADDSCAISTVTAGVEQTVTLTSSDGEEVDFHLPDGWTATVDGEPVSELTISIEELQTREVFDGDIADDVTCFNQFELADPTTGEPSNCYDVQANTDTQTDVTVEFERTADEEKLPILSFCPDQQVLQAVADGLKGYIMTSVEDDTQGAVRRTYPNVSPPGDFGGCGSQISFGDGAVGQFAGMVWQRVRPVLKPLLPKPLYAVDIGFGGELRTLSTIFFWGRTAVDLSVTPDNTSVAVGQEVQLSADPVYPHSEATGSPVAVEWASSDPAVATVDPSGLVTGVEVGTATITATATDVLDTSGSFLSDAATVTVEAATTGTVSISGHVTDATESPLTGAQVQVQGTTLPAAVTDADGNYSLSAVPVGTGTLSLQASLIGFDSQTQSINVVSGGSYTVNFQLTEATTIAGGYGTATVDGVSGQGEWDNAACFPVTMNLPDGGSDPNGEFCFMNDADSMYVRSTYTNTADATDPASTLFFVLDMNGNSDVAGADPGDEGIAQQQSNGNLAPFRDEATNDVNTFDNFSDCPVGSTCSTSDDIVDPQLGTIDGSGGYTNVSGAITFEMSHPLNSGDVTVNNEPLDVSLDAGQSILVRYLQRIGTAGTGHIVEVQIYSAPIN